MNAGWFTQGLIVIGLAWLLYRFRITPLVSAIWVAAAGVSLLAAAFVNKPGANLLLFPLVGMAFVIYVVVRIRSGE